MIPVSITRKCPCHGQNSGDQKEHTGRYEEPVVLVQVSGVHGKKHGQHEKDRGDQIRERYGVVLLSCDLSHLCLLQLRSGVA